MHSSSDRDPGRAPTAPIDSGAGQGMGCLQYPSKQSRLGPLEALIIPEQLDGTGKQKDEPNGDAQGDGGGRAQRPGRPGTCFPLGPMHWLFPTAWNVLPPWIGEFPGLLQVFVQIPSSHQGPP